MEDKIIKVKPYELKYYLDTNAVRSFAPHLKKCRDVGAFTSIWAICEMLGRVLKTPKDFYKIQKNLISIRDAKLCVISQMPDELLAAAFGNSKPKTNASNIIMAMILLIEAISYEQWKSLILENNLEAARRFIEEYDKRGTDHLNKVAKLQHDKDRTINESKECHHQIREQEKATSNIRILKYFAGKELEKYLSHDMKGCLTNEMYDFFIDLILEKYDHSIDVALIVNAWYADKKISYRDMFAKNDDSDMLHLYYIQDDIILVTDDTTLRENVNSEFLGRAISNSDFRKIIENNSPLPNFRKVDVPDFLEAATASSDIGDWGSGAAGLECRV